MKHTYTPEEYNNSTPETDIPLICVGCDHIFYVKKKTIENNKWGHRTFDFCNSECRREHRKKNIMITTNCTNCNTVITKLYSASKRHKNTFCSHSCSTIYLNSHKTFGYKRSKLEIWIEEQLTQIYPELLINYNKKDIINSELDIYIPSLSLAFELNGIFHYEPVFSNERLISTQINDSLKFKKCIENNISLCVIDTSQQKYVKPSTSQKYLDIITKIINENLILKNNIN